MEILELNTFILTDVVYMVIYAFLAAIFIGLFENAMRPILK